MKKGLEEVGRGKISRTKPVKLVERSLKRRRRIVEKKKGVIEDPGVQSWCLEKGTNC